MHSPIFKFQFSGSFEKPSLQKCKFRISVETVKLFGCIKQFCIFAVAYFLPCKLNYGYLNQARFHWYLPNGTLSSCEICHGLWENISFLLIPKSPNIWEKVEKIGLGSFKTFTHSNRKSGLPYCSMPLVHSGSIFFFQLSEKC